MIILVAVVTAVISFGLGYVVAKSRIEQKNRKAQQDAVSLLKKAEQEAQEIKRKAIIEARE
ncbi:Rnase Y domain-containing protein, partial [Pseudothermotoga sp.]